MYTINRIIEEMKKREITQKEFAEKLGITKQAISDWKGDRNKSYFLMMPQIAKILNVSTDYLLGLTDAPQKYEYEFSFEEMKIVQAYRNNPDMQGAVKRILMLDDVESESIDKKEA